MEDIRNRKAVWLLKKWYWLIEWKLSFFTDNNNVRLELYRNYIYYKVLLDGKLKKEE